MRDTAPAAPLRARFGPFVLEQDQARLLRDGQPVDLQPRAFDLLCALVGQPGQLVTKDALLDAVWGHRHVSESVLKTTVSHLRTVLGDDAREPRYLATANRRGYRFIADCLPLDAPTVGVVPASAVPAAAAPSSQAVETAPAALVGRDAALQRLAACAEEARQGRMRLVFVAGDAGIGKSVLIDRFVASPMVAGLARARGQCVEHYGSCEPYMPVLEALNELCRGGSLGDASRRLLRQVAPTWLLQLPWLIDASERETLQRDAAGATGERMLREFGEWLDRRAALGPLLLVLEDLHWCDTATVHWIGYLARRRSTAPVLILGSLRPTELIIEDHPLGALRHELRVHRSAVEVDLEPLAQTDVAALVSAQDGAPADEDFVRALHAHTQGLPLFVAQVLEERAARGAAAVDGEALSIPDNLVGIFTRRIERLAPALQQRLAVASVLGNDFPLALLGTLLDEAEDDLIAALDADPTARHWLHPVEPDGALPAGGLRLAFRHVLCRHAFYQRLGPIQRLRWHRRAADALMAGGGTQAIELASELALHLERAGDPVAAAQRWALVGARALARSAAPEALRAVRHAAALVADRDEAEIGDLALDLCVLEGAALSRIQVLSQPAVRAVFARARALCDRLPRSPSRARALHGLWWTEFARGDLRGARQLAERMLDDAAALGDGALHLAGTSALGVTLTMSGQFDAACGSLREAVALAGQLAAGARQPAYLQDPGVDAAAHLALSAFSVGAFEEAHRLQIAAIERAQAIGHPMSQILALNLAGLIQHLAGDAQGVLALTERISAVIARHQLPDVPGSFTWLHGSARAALGEPEAGLAEIRRGIAAWDSVGMGLGITGAYLHEASACLALGRLDEAEAAAERGIARAHDSGGELVLAPLWRMSAHIAEARGQREAARGMRERGLEVAQRQGARFHAWRIALEMPEQADLAQALTAQLAPTFVRRSARLDQELGM